MNEQTEVAGYVTLDEIVRHCFTEAEGDVRKAIQLAGLYVGGAGPLEEAMRGIVTRGIEATTSSGASLDSAIAELVADVAASAVADRVTPARDNVEILNFVLDEVDEVARRSRQDC